MCYVAYIEIFILKSFKSAERRSQFQIRKKRYCPMLNVLSCLPVYWYTVLLMFNDQCLNHCTDTCLSSGVALWLMMNCSRTWTLSELRAKCFLPPPHVSSVDFDDAPIFSALLSQRKFRRLFDWKFNQNIFQTIQSQLVVYAPAEKKSIIPRRDRFLN